MAKLPKNIHIQYRNSINLLDISPTPIKDELTNDVVDIYKRAISAYEKISKVDSIMIGKLQVKLANFLACHKSRLSEAKKFFQSAVTIFRYRNSKHNNTRTLFCNLNYNRIFTITLN